MYVEYSCINSSEVDSRKFLIRTSHVHFSNLGLVSSSVLLLHLVPPPPPLPSHHVFRGAHVIVNWVNMCSHSRLSVYAIPSAKLLGPLLLFCLSPSAESREKTGKTITDVVLLSCLIRHILSHLFLSVKRVRKSVIKESRAFLPIPFTLPASSLQIESQVVGHARAGADCALPSLVKTKSRFDQCLLCTSIYSCSYFKNALYLCEVLREFRSLYLHKGELDIDLGGIY